MEEIRVHENPSTVYVDWDYALNICESLDKVGSDDDRLPMTGKTAILVLAEYAAIAHKCAWPPENVGLAVVVCPPSVWFCPKEKGKGLEGLFIEPYSKVRHGEGLEFVKRDPDLLDFCSINARRDGWRFAAEMTFAGKGKS